MTVFSNYEMTCTASCIDMCAIPVAMCDCENLLDANTKIEAKAKIDAKDTKFDVSLIDLQWFAAEDEGRTEDPSEHKLERARREEGRVAKSPELASAFVLMLTVTMLIVTAPSIFRTCVEIFRFYFSRCTTAQINDPNLVSAFFSFFARVVLPISIIGIIGAVAGNLIQTRGFIFSLKPIEPKFSKIVPRFGQYFRKTLFSFQGIFNVAKSMGKLVIMVAVAYFLISRDIPILLMSIRNGNILGAIFHVGRMGAALLIAAAVLFLAIAVPDYFVQRHEFREQMKMTKQEVKEEFKELEGDPEVKGRLQQAQQQMLQQNMPRAVAESDVVITNPTHFAVALKYDRAIGERPPEVTAKGADEMAFAIRRIANENDVPIIENKPLARGLYTNTQIGDTIPEEYFKIIAEIYAQVLKISDIK